jgi:hypothetical protein
MHWMEVLSHLVAPAILVNCVRASISIYIPSHDEVEKVVDITLGELQWRTRERDEASNAQLHSLRCGGCETNDGSTLVAVVISCGTGLPPITCLWKIRFRGIFLIEAEIKTRESLH